MSYAVTTWKYTFSSVKFTIYFSSVNSTLSSLSGALNVFSTFIAMSAASAFVILASATLMRLYRSSYVLSLYSRGRLKVLLPNYLYPSRCQQAHTTPSHISNYGQQHAVQHRTDSRGTSNSPEGPG
ncbi:hypothetical protein BJX68DRAFT_236917 [Aspergillus pseudodeflectus]|uniref:TRP C-terminal domain-containing protein n=1 Tax=Aspergillus pseudodeflectus TaxID=176178 RepID=A0ABR4KDP6_9EURO